MSNVEASYQLSHESGHSVLALKPELNNVQWGEIDSIGTNILNSIKSQTSSNLIVDLSGLNYMGSAMVALIVRVWKASQERKGRISVICPNEQVKEVLKLAALDKVWPIVDTEAEALSALGQRSMVSSSSSGGGGVNAGWIVAGVLAVIILAGGFYLMSQ